MLQEYKSVGNCNYQGQIYKTVKQPDAQILTSYTFIHSLVQLLWLNKVRTSIFLDVSMIN